MKKSLFLFILASCALTYVKAQITTYQLSLKDSNLNILYLSGFENTVLIKNLPSGAVVKFDNETISPHAGNDANSKEYYLDLREKKEGNYSLIALNKNHKEIFRKEYSAKKLNNIVVQLGMVKDSFATVEEVLAYPAVISFMPNSYIKTDWYVIGYNIELLKAENSLIMYKDYNGRIPQVAELDEQIKNGIKQMKKGDKIVIKEARILGTHCCGRVFPPIRITIK